MADASTREAEATELPALARAAGLGLLAAGCFAFGWTLVAIPIGVWSLGRALGELAGTKPSSPFLTGWLAWGLVMPLVGAICIGVGLFSTLGRDLGIAALASLVPAAACLWASTLAAPLALAARRTIETDTPLTDALAEGWVAARSRTGFALGVGHGLSVVVLFGIIAGADWIDPPGEWGPSAGALLFILASPFVSGLVIMFALRAAVRAEGLPARPRPWRAFGYAVAPLAACALALAASSPMSTEVPSSIARGPAASDLVASVTDGVVRVVGTEATTVVRPPTQSNGDRGVLQVRSAERVYVGALRDGELVAATFDLAGHRLDDGWRDRLAARFGEEGAWMLGWAAALAVLAVGLARRARRSIVGRVATLLRIELGDDAHLSIEDGEVVPHGDVRLVSTAADRVVRLDRALPWLGAWATSLAEGSTVVLVTPSPEPFLGPRTGTSVVPAAAWLSDGDVETSLARHAARAAAMPAAFAAVVALVASAWSLSWL